MYFYIQSSLFKFVQEYAVEHVIYAVDGVQFASQENQVGWRASLVARKDLFLITT